MSLEMTKLYTDFVSMIDQSDNGNLYKHLVQAARPVFDVSPQPKRMFAVETALVFNELANNNKPKTELNESEIVENKYAVTAYQSLLQACMRNADDRNFFSDMAEAAKKCTPKTEKAVALNNAAIKVFETLGR